MPFGGKVVALGRRAAQRSACALALAAVPVTPQCGVSAMQPKAPVAPASAVATAPDHPPRRITITRPAVITKAVAQRPAVLTQALPKETPKPQPPSGSAIDPKHERFEQRVSPASPAPPLDHAIRLPEEVVLRLLDTGQPAFLRCWARAQREDPSLATAKITVHLELDANGVVQRISTDAKIDTLGNCIRSIAMHLPFPSPGQPAIVEFPLLFR